MEDNKQNEPFVIYCNFAGVSVGVNDISIELKRQSPQQEVTYGTVIMSPQLAKNFANVLLNSVKQYEDLFGTIPNQPDDNKIKELISQGMVSVENGKH
ncbi:DUF3467 domain-containing protein [Ectobacillus polymachus]|uniref:DUF3467 domain-containing protein n=1 Tax=Ectobacillus polymachus TaxID=1508806 RepID=UPI003A878E08